MTGRRTIVTARPGPDGPRATVTVGDAPAAQPSGCCPFYGLVGIRHLLVAGASGGNACTLAMGHAPCAMEMAGHPADWDGCTVRNTAAARSETAAVVRTFGVVGFGASVESEPLWDRFGRIMGRPWDDEAPVALAPALDLRDTRR
jgi:hypothetical protein